MASKKKKNKFLGSFDYSRKMEVAGILTIAISILLLLSIASYQPGDYAVAKSLSYDSLLRVDQGPSLRVNNWLGVAGAYISFLFVHTLFGYVSIGIPLILFSLGWYIFRLKDLRNLIWPFSYAIWLILLISTTLGWFYNEYEAYSLAWSGNSGIYIAGILQNITGYGSIIILFVLLLVSGLVLIDRDIQKSVDRLKSWLEELRENRAVKEQQKTRTSATFCY